MTSTIQYKRTEVIGRGKFGVVYKGYHKQTRQIVAIKVLNLDTQEDEVADVQQEIQFLAELKNAPNVTHYYGSFLVDTKLWIIMDYCAGGSIRTLLRSGIFEERYIGVIVRELLVALQAVHKMGVIHRDLKAANVLITNDGNVQLCDFGVAAKVTSNSIKRSTMVGTPYWMAPEVIREGDTYNSKADIWSLGITIYEIATGNPPYSEKDAMWAMQMISKQTPPRLEGREYSSALKECIALCLDENPEERPLAEDLLKCKLVKTYKGFTTNILKELISRYLLWRDRNTSRESVFINVEEDAQNGANNNLQVKWDFDSLSSREYIIENDIDIDNVKNNYDYNDATDTYQTQPTLQAGSKYNTENNTIPLSHNNTTLKTANTESKNEIPKSLLLLFEENESTIEENTIPEEVPQNGLNENKQSLTIEIPDMDNLSSFNNSAQSSNNNSVQSTPHLQLNKPPPLYHSQSASASLESRFSTNSATNRPRKKTISNSTGSTSTSTLQPSPHTPPYNNPHKSPSSSGIGNQLTTSVTLSPSKSMKALQANSNPLLQPINFKLGENSGNSASSASNQSIQPNSSTTTNNTMAASASNLLKRRPPLHIQMPTPSNLFNNLSALTNDDIDSSTQHDENVNQFGINPSQVANFPLTMTPVTEKSQDKVVPHSSLNSETLSEDVGTREKSDSVSSLRYQQGRKVSSSNLSSLAPNAANSLNSKLYLPRSNNLNSTSPNVVANNQAKSKFPTIPAINSEFFLDSSSKLKLINDLDSMIKLFNQGLDALEDLL